MLSLHEIVEDRQFVKKCARKKTKKKKKALIIILREILHDA